MTYDEPMPWEEEERMKRGRDDAYADYLKSLQDMPEFRYVYSPAREVDELATPLSWWQKLQLWWRFFW